MIFVFTKDLKVTFTQLLLCLSLFISFSVLCNEEKSSLPHNMSEKEKRSKILHLINDEMKTIEMIKFRAGPSLKHRYFELMCEKLAIFHQEDSEKYLKATPVEIKSKGKDFYFSTTRKYYTSAREYGLNIIKDYKGFPKTANIFYSLALNSRDFGNDNRTEKYLLDALKFAINNSPITHLANGSIAEFYYNEKKYDKAISHFEKVLKNSNDEWRSKHLYNAAWCYLKTKNRDKAIRYLFEAHKEGKKHSQINMIDQILEAMAVFHVLANKVDDIIAFYIKETENPVPWLVKTAKHAADKGLFEKAELAIQKGHEIVAKTDNKKDKIDLANLQLDIYRTFKKEEHFFTSAKFIFSLRNFPEIKEELASASEKIKDFTGYLQLRLTENKKKRIRHFDKSLLERIVSYFDILIGINPIEKTHYEFYKAETYFVVGHFNQAKESYKKGIGFAQEDTRDEKIKEEMKRKLVNGLLAAIDETGNESATNQPYLVYAFERHLDFWPVDSTSQKIYPRLFNIYLKKKDFEKSEELLERYNQKYPKDLEIQRHMVTVLLDDYLKKKDSINLSRWAMLLGTGKFAFEKSKIEKINGALGGLLSEDLIKLEKQGKKLEAAEGHAQLWEDKRYPLTVRGQAALNASLAFLEQNNSSDSLEWFEKMLATFPEKNTTEKMSLLLAMTYAHRDMLAFSNSIHISDVLIKKYCNKKITEFHSFLQNSINLKLALGQRMNALDTIKKVQSCQKVDLKDLELEIISQAKLFKDEAVLVALWKENKISEDFLSSMASDWEEKYWQSVAEDMVKPEWGLSEFKESQKKLINIPIYFKKYVNIQTQWEHIEKVTNEFSKSLKSIPFPINQVFDPTTFQKDIKTRLDLINNFEELISQISKSSKVEVIAYATIKAINLWHKFLFSIKNYNPGLANPEHNKKVIEQMQLLAKSLKDKPIVLENTFHKILNHSNASSFVWQARPTYLAFNHDPSPIRFIPDENKKPFALTFDLPGSK